MSTIDDPSLERSLKLDLTPELLLYVVTHFFLPVKLPEKRDYTIEKDLSLAHVVSAAVHDYLTYINRTVDYQWYPIKRMLDELQASAQSMNLDKDRVVSQLRQMQIGDLLAFYIRRHRSGIILRKQKNCTLFELFKVSGEAVNGTAGPLVHSYPEFSIEVPNGTLDDWDFQFKLADHLCFSSKDRGRRTTELYNSILQCAGKMVVAPSITKRIREQVMQEWRRSSLWLFIKVIIQMSLDRSHSGRTSYKAFMLFFMCTIANDTNIATLSTELLHVIASKILRRLGKLGSSVPGWLSGTALKACAGLRVILDTRWARLSSRPSPFRNPSQDELERDARLSFEYSQEYIQNALANRICEPSRNSFHPKHPRRHTIDDFLSLDGVFFDEACRADLDVALCDVEHVVEDQIDDWVACVTDVEEACNKLGILMDKYMAMADYKSSEGESIKLLTSLELFVAIDKLVVKEIPMLVDYAPEVSVAALQNLFLRKRTNYHRFSRVYEYIAARGPRSHLGWSNLSHGFMEYSLPVRYYDQSPDLRRLAARIENDAVINCDKSRRRHSSLQQNAKNSRSPLLASPLHAKVVVFELQCPPCIRIWRSTAALLSFYFQDDLQGFPEEEEDKLLFHDPMLHSYFVDRCKPPLHTQIHLVTSGSKLHYAIGRTNMLRNPMLRNHLLQDFYDAPRYVIDTSETPNDALAAQADCPSDFSLNEFIAFGHLRSGGSLQWVNILRSLRSRTLNLRHHNVHILLSCAISQVGPFDLSTGTYIWHQELSEPTFCNALLDELEDLFMDVATHSIDAVVMKNISLLLTRLLESSPSRGVSERAIVLLHRVRRKAFDWMEKLSYDLAMAPTNQERHGLLLDTASACRSTFDVDHLILSKLFESVDDISAALYCAFLIYELASDRNVIQQHRRLLVALEGILTDVILADVSDCGIDLAIRKIFPIHKPGTSRWTRLERPDIRWLVGQTGDTADQASRTVHLNLSIGELRADGQPAGKLARTIRENLDWKYKKFSYNQGLFVLPGVDSTSLATIAEDKVHVSLRGDYLIVQAKSRHSKSILEWIPPGVLQHDLPTALVNGHVHWLNLSTGIIEIRPLERPWHESSENWKIDCRSGQYRAFRGRENLLDINSPTWAMVSQCFECLDIFTDYVDKMFRKPNDLLVTTISIESAECTPVLRLSATLPRRGLSFDVNASGEFESSDFKHMVYDENQHIGTLYGPRRFLVLRPKTHLPVKTPAWPTSTNSDTTATGTSTTLYPNLAYAYEPPVDSARQPPTSALPTSLTPASYTTTPEELIPKRILIPNGLPQSFGEVALTQEQDNTTAGEPLYHIYDVDTELGCLVGTGSLSSTRQLAYVHVATSWDRPDPLTHKTGAQMALCLLESAACQSVMKLKGFDSDRCWASTPYPQINKAYQEIQNRYYWTGKTRDPDAPDWVYDDDSDQRRAEYLFSWYTTGLASPPVAGVCNAQTQWPITLDRLLSSRLAPDLPPTITLRRDLRKTSSENIPEIDRLFACFGTNGTSFQQEYIAHLGVSAQCMGDDSRIIYTLTGKDRVNTLKEYYARCRANYLVALGILQDRLGPTDPWERALSQFAQWPPVTADFLLRCLASSSPVILPDQWKKCLISLALLLLDVQRARRLLRFAIDGLEEDFLKELENEGCDGWCPDEHPDWLLIQIQGNFLIRRTQAEVAMEMIFPKSGQNTLIQVNMGEGKSSVIIPIVASFLADGKQLARVIVPKTLTSQMFEVLVSRLGGLANRPIYCLPFSRSPKYDNDGRVTGLDVESLQNLMSRCMAERGILLMQPEHVASLKLITMEKQLHSKGQLVAGPLRKDLSSAYKRIMSVLSPQWLPGDSFVGNLFGLLAPSANSSSNKNIKRAKKHTSGSSRGKTKWLSLRTWMDSHIRDILDESDEILHPRFQLIYTIGLEQHIDGYPDRWTITQQVLRLVKECIQALSRQHPGSIKIEGGPPGSFPRIGLAQPSDISQRITPMIVEHVMAGRIPNLDFRVISPELFDAIRSFISDEEVLQVPHTVKRVEECAKRSDQSSLWSGLLLLRGLLASNILLFAPSERRWRVDYGLALQLPNSDSLWSPVSTKLAIPYRAKDMPAPNTQFGHPDITIVLTCLSYYYSGLTEEQLRYSFEILLDQDDPYTEYALWTKDHDNDLLPASIRTLDDMNLKSSEEWDKVIFPLFSRNQAVIDFYLAWVVFPKEAKEFPWKLSASSWDLVEKTEKLVTGFSGTNDNRWLLPMSIAQRDLDHQKGTNARVLAHLLQPENDCYIALHKDGERLATHELLQIVAAQTPKILVLLDVGAQILDLSNRQVARAWLDIARDAAGAIYFDENDELMVLTRNDTAAPMLSSPLSQHLDRCVVYLDHAHTRGTDIQLPIKSRAAVTLGPKLTKDRLVQGCMRMRKLGRGHSVMFFAPPEVDLSIRAFKKDHNGQITTVDILCWTIHETWADIRQRAPYWAQQGMDHKSRHNAWSLFSRNELAADRLSDALLQPAYRSLEDLYAPCKTEKSKNSLSTLDPAIQQRCKHLGILSLPSAQIDEEHEREVHREREREREVEDLPPKAKPAKHSLHPDVTALVRTGVLPPLSSGGAFRPVFTTLEKSSAATFEADVWSPSILATVDFCDTIKPRSTKGTMDQYLRPVQWILSLAKNHDPLLVLLSPFEVDRLMPEIRISEHVHLHVYAPRTSQRMRPSDDLKLYSIPPLPSDWTPPWDLIDQLNVFAGQLYLRDYQSYLRLCHFLGVPTQDSPSDEIVQRNVFKIPGSFEEDEITFLSSPLPPVMALLAIRNRGRPFSHTHMGKILYGQTLTEKDFRASRRGPRAELTKAEA